MVRTFQPKTDRYTTFMISTPLYQAVNQLSFATDMSKSALWRLGMRRLIADFNEGRNVHPAGILPGNNK